MKKEDFYNTKFLIESPEQFDRITGKLLKLGFTWYGSTASARETAKVIFAHRKGEYIASLEDPTVFYSDQSRSRNPFKRAYEADLCPEHIMTPVTVYGPHPVVPITPEIESLLDSLDNLI